MDSGRRKPPKPNKPPDSRTTSTQSKATRKSTSAPKAEKQERDTRSSSNFLSAGVTQRITKSSHPTEKASGEVKNKQRMKRGPGDTITTSLSRKDTSTLKSKSDAQTDNKVDGVAIPVSESSNEMNSKKVSKNMLPRSSTNPSDNVESHCSGMTPNGTYVKVTVSYSKRREDGTESDSSYEWGELEHKITENMNGTKQEKVTVPGFDGMVDQDSGQARGIRGDHPLGILRSSALHGLIFARVRVGQYTIIRTPGNGEPSTSINRHEGCDGVIIVGKTHSDKSQRTNIEANTTNVSDVHPATRNMLRDMRRWASEGRENMIVFLEPGQFDQDWVRELACDIGDRWREGKDDMMPFNGVLGCTEGLWAFYCHTKHKEKQGWLDSPEIARTYTPLRLEDHPRDRRNIRNPSSSTLAQQSEGPNLSPNPEQRDVFWSKEQLHHWIDRSGTTADEETQFMTKPTAKSGENCL